MRIVLNGTVSELPLSATVEAAIEATGTASRTGLAVAVDGEIVPRGEWSHTKLSDGQRVEVLQAVQGGA